MARTLLYGNSGMDVVNLKSNNICDVVSAIRQRIELVGENIPVLVEARLTPSQCAEVLKEFPAYNRCFQESGSLVYIGHD